MFVEDFVMKMEVEGRDRELDPGRAEDVPCPGEAQDAVISKCVGVFWIVVSFKLPSNKINKMSQ